MNDINPILFLVSLVGVTIWHELGHLLVARRLGVPVVSLNVGFGPVLWRHRIHQAPDLVLRGLPLGMSVAIPARRTSNGQTTRPYAHDFWIAVAGSAASFVLTLLLFAIARWLPMPYIVAHSLVGVGLLSAGVALLNLLPIPGLDGGHLLMLAAARKGWEMTPAQELRLQRTTIQWIMIVCLVPLVFTLWTRMLTGLL